MTSTEEQGDRDSSPSVERIVDQKTRAPAQSNSSQPTEHAIELCMAQNVSAHLHRKSLGPWNDLATGQDLSPGQQLMVDIDLDRAYIGARATQRAGVR